MKFTNKPIVMLAAVVLLLATFFVSFYTISQTKESAVKVGGDTEIVQSKTSETNSDKPKSKVNENNASTSLANDAKSSANYTEDVVKNDKIVDSSGNEYPIREYKLLLTPNDPNATQWWTTSTGLEQAWGIGGGSTPTTIAIIDTGFDLGHEEFSGRWYQNSGELGATSTEAPSDYNCSDQSIALDAACNNIDDNFNGVVDDEFGATTTENPSRLNCTDRSLALDKSCNLLDDDGNGLADDVTGWDFVNYDSVVEAGETNPSGSGTRHGTEVAGVAAATGNNGKGIAGVNWSSKILPIQALNDDSYGDTLTVSRAVRYAADQGADVISISLGSTLYDNYLRQAVDYAVTSGSVVVAASGNDGCDCINYPANFPEVVAVGASDSAGARASFSNWGANLDLVAPGVSIETTVWDAASDSQYVSSVAGTSFSTPFVSGLLALMRSWQPNATWGELVAAMSAEADHSALGVGENHSTVYGFGDALAGQAMNRVVTPRSSVQEYRYTPFTVADQLDSALVYQCSGSDWPSASIYRLRKDGQIRYTVSELQRYQSETAGWVSSFIGYSCSGLPTDTANSVRQINLLREIENSSLKSL